MVFGEHQCQSPVYTGAEGKGPQGQDGRRGGPEVPHTTHLWGLLTGSHPNASIPTGPLGTIAQLASISLPILSSVIPEAWRTQGILHSENSYYLYPCILLSI